MATIANFGKYPTLPVPNQNLYQFDDDPMDIEGLDFNVRLSNIFDDPPQQQQQQQQVQHQDLFRTPRRDNLFAQGNQRSPFYQIQQIDRTPLLDNQQQRQAFLPLTPASGRLYNAPPITDAQPANSGFFSMIDRSPSQFRRERPQPDLNSFRAPPQTDHGFETGLLALMMRNKARINRLDIAIEAHTLQSGRDLLRIYREYVKNLNTQIKHAFEKKIEEDRKKAATLFQQ